MAEISTMNLSIQSLEKWKSEKKVPIIPMRNSRTSLRIKKELNFDNPADNGTESVVSDATHTTEVGSSLISHDLEGQSHSVDPSQSTNMCAYPARYSSSSQTLQTTSTEPMTRVFFDNTLFHSEDHRTACGSTALYTSLKDMSSLGLKMCQNEDKALSLIRGKQHPSNCIESPSSTEENEQIAELLGVVTQSRELHQELLTKISTLAGGTLLANFGSKMEEMEKSLLKNQTDISSLQKQVSILTSQLNKSTEKQPARTRSSGRKVVSPASSFIVDEEDEIDSDQEKSISFDDISDDSGESDGSSSVGSFPPAKVLRSARKSLSSSSNVAQIDLPLDIHEFIDDCNLELKRHGLLCRNVVVWAENRAEPLPWKQTHVGRFLNKKMDEAESRSTMAYMQEFIRDVIHNDKPALRPKCKKLRPLSYAEHSDHSDSSSIKTLSSSSSDREDCGGNNCTGSELSRETEYFIDDCKRKMVSNELSYKDLLSWSRQNGEVKLELPAISHFMHKKMKEGECLRLMPHIKRFLEEKTSKRRPSTVATKNGATSKSSSVRNQNSRRRTDQHSKNTRSKRLVFPSDHIDVLEEAFRESQILTMETKDKLSRQLDVTPGRVRQWFKRRRTKERKGIRTRTR